MSRSRKNRIRLLTLVLAAAALLVPVTFAENSVELNDACADGTCCLEPGSVCEKDGEIIFDYVDRGERCPNVRT